MVKCAVDEAPAANFIAPELKSLKIEILPPPALYINVSEGSIIPAPSLVDEFLPSEAKPELLVVKVYSAIALAPASVLVTDIAVPLLEFFVKPNDVLNVALVPVNAPPKSKQVLNLPTAEQTAVLP